MRNPTIEQYKKSVYLSPTSEENLDALAHAIHTNFFDMEHKTQRLPDETGLFYELVNDTHPVKLEQIERALLIIVHQFETNGGNWSPYQLNITRPKSMIDRHWTIKITDCRTFPFKEHVFARRNEDDEITTNQKFQGKTLFEMIDDLNKSKKPEKRNAS